MLDSRLHGPRRNSPLRALKVELSPACVAKLAGPHKEEEGELQSDADDLAASVSVDRTQQFSQSRGIGDPWSVANLRRLKKTAQIFRDVPLDIAQADGVSKHAAATLLGPSCGIPQALELNLLEHHEELVRSDVGDRTSSQGRKDVALEDPSCIFQRIGCQLSFRDARLQELEPLACNRFERARVRRTLLFAIDTGIDVPCEEPAGIGVQETGSSQIDAGVHAEGYHPFGMLKAITEPPPFRTPWHHMKTHAVFVGRT